MRNLTDKDVQNPFWNFKLPPEGEISDWPHHELENIIMMWDKYPQVTVTQALCELKRREIRCSKDRDEKAPTKQ